jgi:hypothetical protein
MSIFIQPYVKTERNAHATKIVYASFGYPAISSKFLISDLTNIFK